MKKKFRRNEEGAVMVFVALLIVVLLAFTALAVDFGTAYYQRQKLQTACDAAALAGVQYLPDTVKAETVAKDYLKVNFNNDVVTNVEFLDSNQKIRVTADFDSATTFGRILGNKNIDVTTHAAAGTKTITIPGGDFPYLLYSQADGETLHLGGKCHVNGAVHSNGNVQFDAENNEGEVSQISVGGALNFINGKMFIGSGTDRKEYYLCKYETWGFQKLSSTNGQNLDVADLPDGIEKYYLIPEGPIKDDAGNQVVDAWGQVSNTLTPDYIANHSFYKETEQVQIYPLSAYTDCLKKESFTDWDNDEPLKTITKLEKQCKDRIKTLKEGYDSATNASTIAGYSTSTESLYLASSHSETSPVVVDLGGDKDVNVGSTEQKNSTIVFKGNSVQFMKLTGTKSRVNNLVFLSDSATTTHPNGIEYNSIVDMIIKGNISSNKSLKISCNDSTKKIVINGNIYVDGDLEMKNIVVKGDIYATGNINIQGCDVNGFLGAKGNISYQGMPSSMVSYSKDNPNALSVYSEEGNVDFIGANGDTPQTVVGVVLCMKGKATMHADFKFYGNVIGNEIGTTSGSEWSAYPIKELPGYESLDPSIIHVDEGEDKTETTFVLVE
ncbi:pilus assembly protein TadG-related protein [Eubacterium sp.]|uniref:pilus assembly protein TadG-related protein n=1 Tax=Eubacterium sp. TaxID=142586 RepID=UPI0025F3F69D|nr:pilus assembly protein TadG-related protein [Eubacterium sp.]MCR5629251.1 hypothetical protein [Eubacterium sp.]